MVRVFFVLSISMLRGVKKGFLGLIVFGVVGALCSLPAQSNSLGRTENPFRRESRNTATTNQEVEETLEERVERLKAELAAAEDELAAQRDAERDESQFDGAVVDIPIGALVVISSDASEGSGFVAKMRDRYFLVTNIHVLGAARGGSFTTIEGRELRLPSNAFVSKARDIAIVPIQWDGPYLDVVESFALQGVEIGQDVTVMGNSSGARVATQLKGVVKGIGPREIEVSAKFVPGNSGSPIVLDRAGTVIGVASHLRDYSKVSEYTKDSELGDVRRFGFRLDGNIEWQLIAMEQLFDQAEMFHSFEDRTKAMFQISYMLEYESQLLTNYSSHESLGHLFDKIGADFNWNRGTASAHNTQLLKRFINGLQSELQKDLQSTERGLSVDFYKDRYYDIRGLRSLTDRSLQRFSRARL